MVLCDLAGGYAPDADRVIVTLVIACSFLNTCTKVELTALHVSGWKGELCCSSSKSGITLTGSKSRLKLCFSYFVTTNYHL